MRIGILTQPLRRNYGGVLQNYALQTVLRRMGHEPITVDYSHSRKKVYKVWLISRIKTLLLRMVGRGRDRRTFRASPFFRTKDFSRFVRRHIATTRPVTEYSASLIRKYRLDVIVVGSDQVWRPKYNGEQLMAMYLDFAVQYHIKRIAYAASFGVDKWEYDERQTAECRQLVALFNAISVREASGVDLCRDYLGVDAESVLDPTLLLCKDDYLRLCSDIKSGGYVCKHGKTPDCPYCIAFMLDINEEKMAFARKQARDRGINELFLLQCNENVTVSIEMWLAAIRDASLVVTDSFHGTVFSLLFEREFITIANSSRGLARMTALLEITGLTPRLAMDDSLATFDSASLPPVDGQLVNKRLSGMREVSIAFLTKALS